MGEGPQARVLSGRYRVEELIGRGGMASVYRGHDLTLDREVAIKVLKRDLAGDNGFRTRFRLEAQAASRMSHPTIVRVFDAGEATQTDADGSVHPVPFIVMELVRGRLLKDIIAAGPVPISDSLRYVDGILEALEYSHRAGVVHRDIKPGNVMVTEDGHIKVMDFGIARAVSDSSATVAETTAIVGTASYFSPEQAKGEPVDGRADLYSVGVVLYELLTGRTPFRGESPVAVAYQHVQEEPAPPSSVVASIPPVLDEITLRALAKDPFQRFPDAGAFRRALREGPKSGAKGRSTGIRATPTAGSTPAPRQGDPARELDELASATPALVVAQDREDRLGPPAVLIWVGVVVIAALLVAASVWVTGLRTTPTTPATPTGLTVPDVVDMAWQQRAKALFADAKISVTVVSENSESIAEGNVISTDPAAGTPLTKNQRVTVHVSAGQKRSTMPDIINMTRAQAELALTRAGLTLGRVLQRDDPDLDANTVMDADQTANDQIAVGTSVNLVVSSGRVDLPDLRDYPLAAAKRALTADNLKLTAEVTKDPSCPATAGQIVTAQSLPAGGVPIHSTVTLTVCSGTP